MKSFTLNLLTVAAALAVGTLARADGMTKTERQAAEKTIEADATAGRTGCDSRAGNAKDVCVAEVKGREHVAKAELESEYAPTAKTRNAVRVARADATYGVSVERCDDRAGTDKDVCVKEAKAARTIALADAKTRLTTTKAKAVADEKSANADAEASAIGAEARTDAAGEKADAEYAVAREKCNSLAGPSKDSCVREATERFGQH